MLIIVQPSRNIQIMCEVTDFKIDNITKKCGWNAYFDYLIEAANYSKNSNDFDADEKRFMQQIVFYYKSIKLDPSYDTMEVNQTFPKDFLEKMCNVSAKLGLQFKKEEAKVFMENMDFSFKSLYKRSPNYTVIRKL